MATEVYKDSTSHSFFFELVDSTTGLPKTGIVYSAVTGSYVRTRGERVAITMATLASASSAWSSGGFILVDDTNQPGVVRLDAPNAAFADGAEEVVITLKATGCRSQSRAFTLININKQTAKVPATIAAGDIATDAITAASVKADAVTKIQNGLATGTDVSNLQTHGDSTWATATGFAVPGSEMDLVAAPNATAVTAIKNGLATSTALTAAQSAITSAVGTPLQSASYTAPLNAAQTAAAVLDATALSYDTAGSIGEKINSSGAAGDPLDNAVPGSYAAGTAGFALGEVAAVRVLGPIGSTVTRPGEVLPGETIVAYHYAPVEAGPILVTDEDGVAIDLSSYATDLAIVIFSTNGVTETKIGQINYPNVTVGGTSNNQVSFSGSSALTVTIGRFQYGLRRRTSGAKFVRAHGEFIVRPMADVT